MNSMNSKTTVIGLVAAIAVLSGGLGFSMTGAFIPAGDYVLTILGFTPTDVEICINDIVLSGFFGSAIIAEGECVEGPPPPSLCIFIKPCVLFSGFNICLFN